MRQKSFKISLLILASAFLLGHQLTPHKHDTPEFTRAKITVNFYLASIFAPDLGPNHLKQYFPQFQIQDWHEDGTNLPLIIPYGFNFQEIIFITDPGAQPFCQQPVNTPHKANFYKNNSERGPPFSA